MVANKKSRTKLLQRLLQQILRSPGPPVLVTAGLLLGLGLLGLMWSVVQFGPRANESGVTTRQPDPDGISQARTGSPSTVSPKATGAPKAPTGSDSTADPAPGSGGSPGLPLPATPSLSLYAKFGNLEFTAQNVQPDNLQLLIHPVKTLVPQLDLLTSGALEVLSVSGSGLLGAISMPAMPGMVVGDEYAVKVCVNDNGDCGLSSNQMLATVTRIDITLSGIVYSYSFESY